LTAFDRRTGRRTDGFLVAIRALRPDMTYNVFGGTLNLTQFSTCREGERDWCEEKGKGGKEEKGKGKEDERKGGRERERWYP